MVGQASWITLMVVLTGFALIAMMAAWSLRTVTRYRSRHARRICPKTGSLAQLIVRYDSQLGRADRVERCELLEDPDRVTCAQGCIAERPVIEQ
jgi:hypothetical protein